MMNLELPNYVNEHPWDSYGCWKMTEYIISPFSSASNNEVMQWYVHEKQKWFEKLLNYYLINNG